MTQPLFETVYVPDMHVAICHKHGDPDCSEVRIPRAHYHPLTSISSVATIQPPRLLWTSPSPSERHALNKGSNALKHGLRQSVEIAELVAVPLCDHGTVLLRDVDYLERVCENPMYFLRLPGDQAPERIVGWLEGGSGSVHS